MQGILNPDEVFSSDTSEILKTFDFADETESLIASTDDSIGDWSDSGSNFIVAQCEALERFNLRTTFIQGLVVTERRLLAVALELMPVALS